MKTIALAVLAAGASRRFGEANKLMTQWGGRPLVAHTLQTFDSTAFAKRMVIVPENHHALAALCEKLGFDIVDNPFAANGIASSIVLAAEKCSSFDGLMIALADMPRIDKSTIALLASTFQSAPGDAIVAPELNGRRGHPVIFSKSHLPDLASLSGDVGAASVIRSHPNSYIGVDVDDEGVAIDFDTPADFERS